MVVRLFAFSKLQKNYRIDSTPRILLYFLTTLLVFYFLLGSLTNNSSYNYSFNNFRTIIILNYNKIILRFVNHSEKSFEFQNNVISWRYQIRSYTGIRIWRFCFCLYNFRFKWKWLLLPQIWPFCSKIWPIWPVWPVWSICSWRMPPELSSWTFCSWWVPPVSCSCPSCCCCCCCCCSSCWSCCPWPLKVVTLVKFQAWQLI